MNTSANFMENRNSIAKSKILAKLRTNQDFMMNTQVSSTPQVWTRWHQERVLNQEMDQPTNGMRNQRYIQIIKEICLTEFQPKLVCWAQLLKDEHKKGLNVIKTVVDLKGQKRFKKSKDASEDIAIDMDVNFTDKNVNAKAVFRKMMTTTSYAKTFGQKPKTEADFHVLNKKKLGDVQISQILKPHVVEILNRWLRINDQDKFTGRIHATCREMFTHVKAQMAEKPTSHDIFSTQKQLPTNSMPRFDKLAQQNAKDIRNRNASSNKALDRINERRVKSYFETVDNKIGAAHRNLTPNRLTGMRYDGPVMIIPKNFKQEFLKGDGDTIYYCDKNELNHTSYQATLKGEKVKGEPATILDHNRLSLVQNVIPDPHTVTGSQNMFKSLEQDRMNLSRRVFQKSGFESLSPGRELGQRSHVSSYTPVQSRKSNRYCAPAGVQLHNALNDFYLRR